MALCYVKVLDERIGKSVLSLSGIRAQGHRSVFHEYLDQTFAHSTVAVTCCTRKD